MSEELESRIQQHLSAKAAFVDDVPFDPDTPATLASNRYRFRVTATMATLVVLAVAAATIVSLRTDSDELNSVATASEELAWEPVEFPGNPSQRPPHIIWSGSDFIALSSAQELWRSDDGRQWSRFENDPPGIQPAGITASNGTLISWGSPNASKSIPEPQEVLVSTDNGMTWESMGTIGQLDDEVDSSPYLAVSEALSQVTISGDFVVATTSSGLSLDLDRILADRGLSPSAEDFAPGWANGADGFEIWLDGRSLRLTPPDITILPAELGATEEELKVMQERIPSGVYSAEIGELLQRVELDDDTEIDTVGVTPTGFVATAFRYGERRHPVLVSTDGLDWDVVAGADESLVGPVLHDGVIYGSSNLIDPSMRRSLDGGKTWEELTEVDDLLGAVFAGPAGLIVIGPPADLFFDSAPDDHPDSIIAWSPDLQRWKRQSVTEEFGRNALVGFAVGERHVVASVRSRTADPGPPVVYVAELP